MASRVDGITGSLSLNRGLEWIGVDWKEYSVYHAHSSQCTQRFHLPLRSNPLCDAVLCAMYAPSWQTRSWLGVKQTVPRK